MLKLEGEWMIQKDLEKLSEEVEKELEPQFKKHIWILQQVMELMNLEEIK